MAFDHLSDAQLLAKLIGVRESRRLYQGTLRPLFVPEQGQRIATTNAVSLASL